MYTPHGHHVPGTKTEKAKDDPLRTKNCGGIGLCPDCTKINKQLQKYRAGIPKDLKNLTTKSFNGRK